MFLALYISGCGMVCVNVQIILSSCIYIVGDLLPLCCVYYVFWFSDKSKKVKESKTKLLLIPAPNKQITRTSTEGVIDIEED